MVATNNNHNNNITCRHKHTVRLKNMKLKLLKLIPHSLWL